ncbi:Hsp70 family protein [Streptomyces sp. NPDC097610]
MGRRRIEVTFDIDSDGIVGITAKDQTTGKPQPMAITYPTA